MQMSLMPVAAPKVRGLEISGKCLPAREVGGDFFNYLEVDRGDEVGIVVADACGRADRSRIGWGRTRACCSTMESPSRNSTRVTGWAGTGFEPSGKGTRGNCGLLPMEG